MIQTMKHFKILTILISIFIFGHINGQTTYSVCYVHKVNSQNDRFFLKTIPFDNIEQTSTGKTTVYTSDSVELYSISRSFEVSSNRKEIFLSNDGQNIAYIIDREFYWNDTQNKSIELFENGKHVKSFSLTELITCDSDNEDCFLFYKDAIDSIYWENGERVIEYKVDASDFEKQLTKKSASFSNDTLYIFTKTKELLEIDIKTGAIGKSPMDSVSQIKFEQLDPIKIESEKFKPSSLYGLPNLSNGEDFEESMAKFLDMAVFPEDSRKSNNYKRYGLNLQIIVDSAGNAQLDKIENYKNLPEEKIKEFVSSNLFEIQHIPNGIEKWRFDGWVTLMNKSKKEAKKERQQELQEEREAYKKRIVADSIDGLYIPKNLEECFIELNKLLKPKDIEAIKNLKDREETIMYHHGMGTWLRNNWGLWGGSRLQQYLLKKGIKHPDSMSALILEYYYDWLNGENEGWKKFDNE